LDWKDHLIYMRHRKKINVKDVLTIGCVLPPAPDMPQTILIGYLMSMDAMRAELTTGAVHLTSMENIKVRLKSGESEKGAIMKQTTPLKKIKTLFLVRRTFILEAQR